MKVLIIGLGSIGKKHFHSLHKYKERFNLDIFRYNTGLNKDNVNESFDIEGFPSLASALQQKPDCAIIANPTSLHVNTSIACAKYGIPFFVEKPLSHSYENVPQLLNIVQTKKLVTQMGLCLRYHPGLIALKKIIQSHQLGKTYDFSISCESFLPKWRPWQDYRNSYSARQELGGGVVLDLIHELDYAHWLFGDFERIKSITSRVSNLQIETEDTAKIIIQTINNVLGNISLNYHRKIPRRKIRVNFENGSAILDLITNHLELSTINNTENITYEIDNNYIFDRQMSDFLENILKNQASDHDIFEGSKVLKYALYIKEEGRVI